MKARREFEEEKLDKGPLLKKQRPSNISSLLLYLVYREKEKKN